MTTGGVHALISLLNLYLDYPILSGDLGLIPDGPRLVSIYSEFDFSTLLANFPTLLFWLPAKTLIVTGIVAACVMLVSVCYSFTVSRIASFLVFLVLLSFSNSFGIVLWFPWDCLLFEVLFLTAVCPDSDWVFELLLFRVMFGFGKHKFLGAGIEDLTYTKSMVCWQPLSTNLGWYFAFAPDWVHVIFILGTFFVEIICPFFLFAQRRLKFFACLSIILLMCGIQLTGHFGWFNTLTMCIAIVVMQPVCYTAKLPRRRVNGGGVVKFSYLIIALIFLIPSQWNSPSLFYQETFSHSSFWTIVQTVSSWRILHTYGVFPPKEMPMIKPVGIFTLDDTHTFSYTYQTKSHWPLAVAPFRFPRFDYIVGFYAASHVFSLVTRLGVTAGTGEEYIDSVGRMILNNPERISWYFENANMINTTIYNTTHHVKFSIVGLVPDWEKGWVQVSSEIDKIYTPSDFIVQAQFSFTDSLPPNLIALRRKSLVYKRVEALEIAELTRHNIEAIFPTGVDHRLFDAAVVLVSGENTFGVNTEREWLGRVVSRFDLAIEHLWPVDHATTFGGYIGCLTFAHLIPPNFHSPICELVLTKNRKERKPGNSYSKIPIDDFLYWILQIPT